MATVKTWGDLSQAFMDQYSFNLDLIPKREDLVAIQQMPHETFRKYVSRWRTLASQIKDKSLEEESIEIITRRAQLAIGGLLSIQPVINFTSLNWAGTRVERSLRSGNFPALTKYAK